MSQDNIETYKKKLYYVTKKSTTITDQDKSKIYQAIRNQQSQTVDDLQMLLDEQLKFEIVLEVCENVNQLPDDFQQDEQETMIDSNQQVDNQEPQHYDQNVQQNNYNQYNDNNLNNGYYQQQNDYNSSYDNHNQQNQQYNTQNYSNSNISQNQEQVVQNYNRQYPNYDNDNNSNNNNGNIYNQEYQQQQQQNQYDQYPQQSQQLQMQQNQLYTQNIGYNNNNNNLRAPIQQQSSAPSNNQRQQQQSQPLMQQSLSQHSDQSQNQMVNQQQLNQKRQSQQYPQEQNQENTPQKIFDKKIQDLINSTIDIKTDTGSGYEQYQNKFNELRESILKYKEDNKEKLEKYQDPKEKFSNFLSLIPTKFKNFLHDTLQIGQKMLNNIFKIIMSNIEKDLRGKDIGEAQKIIKEKKNIIQAAKNQSKRLGFLDIAEQIAELKDQELSEQFSIEFIFYGRQRYIFDKIKDLQSIDQVLFKEVCEKIQQELDSKKKIYQKSEKLNSQETKHKIQEEIFEYFYGIVDLIYLNIFLCKVRYNDFSHEQMKQNIQGILNEWPIIKVRKLYYENLEGAKLVQFIQYQKCYQFLNTHIKDSDEYFLKAFDILNKLCLEQKALNESIQLPNNIQSIINFYRTNEMIKFKKFTFYLLEDFKPFFTEKKNDDYTKIMEEIKGRYLRQSIFEMIQDFQIKYLWKLQLVKVAMNQNEKIVKKMFSFNNKQIKELDRNSLYNDILNTYVWDSAPNQKNKYSFPINISVQKFQFYCTPEDLDSLVKAYLKFVLSIQYSLQIKNMHIVTMQNVTTNQTQQKQQQQQQQQQILMPKIESYLKMLQRIINKGFEIDGQFIKNEISNFINPQQKIPEQVLTHADDVGKIYRSFVEQAEKSTENKSKKSKKNQQKKEESARPSSSSQINQKEDSNQIGQKLESAPQKNEAFQKQQSSQIYKSQQLNTQNSVNLEKSNISSNINIQKNISTNANANKKLTSEKSKQPAKIIYEETKLPDYTDIQKQKIKECQNLFNIKGIESHLENKTNLYSVRNLLENELPLQFKKYMSTVLLSCIKEAYQERNGEEFQLFSNNNVYQEQKTVELFGIFKGQRLQPRKKRNLSSILSEDNPYKQKQIAFEYAQEKNFAQTQDVIAKKIKLSNRMDPFIDYQLQDRNQNEFCQNLIDNLKKEQEKQDKNQEEQNNQKKSKKGNKNPIDEMQKSQTLQDKLKSEKNQDQKKQQEEQKKQQQKNDQIEFLKKISRFIKFQQDPNYEEIKKQAVNDLQGDSILEKIFIDRGKQLISLPKEINYNHLILHLSQQQDIHSKKILQKLLLNLDRTIRK